MDWFTPKLVADEIGSFFRRCEAAKMAGGIPLYRVVDEQIKPPDGWVFDWQTQYYVPPNADLSAAVQ